MPSPHPSRKRRFFTVLMLGLLVLALAACEWTDLVDGDDDEDDGGSDNTPPATETNVPGLSVAVSSSDFDTTLAAITSRTSDRNIATVDHQANAQQAGRSLRPTTTVLFDDPNRSSPLIAADPRAGLDLPTRVLVYRDSDSDVAAAYTNAAYLDARYDLDDAEAGALDGLDADLEALVGDATGDDPGAGPASGIGEGEGIESVSSDNSFADTVDALLAAIDARSDRLGSPTTVNQQTRANSVGRMLDPSTLVLFTVAEEDSALLRASQTSGVDLPQKMLVSADSSGAVTVYYNDPSFIAARHDIDGRDDDIDALADLLADLASEAAGSSTATGTPNTPDTDDDTEAGQASP